jgi:hypothetical protein
MTYQPRKLTFGASPFFSTNRTTTQAFTTAPNDFLFDVFNNVRESSNAGYLRLDTDSFLIGELRVPTSGSTDRTFFDIAIKGHVGSEGYQARSNHNASVLMDDACYGVLSSNSETTIRVMNEASSVAPFTDADELRILGFRV